jgi:hypothetical protein
VALGKGEVKTLEGVVKRRGVSRNTPAGASQFTRFVRSEWHSSLDQEPVNAAAEVAKIGLITAPEFADC